MFTAKKNFIKKKAKLQGGEHVASEKRHEKIREIEELVNDLKALLKKHGEKLDLKTDTEIIEIASQLNKVLEDYNEKFIEK